MLLALQVLKDSTLHSDSDIALLSYSKCQHEDNTLNQTEEVSKVLSHHYYVTISLVGNSEVVLQAVHCIT